MHIHPVFHVSLLEPQVANTFPDRVVAPPLPTQVDDLPPEFEVKSVVDSRYFHRKFQYKVDWVDYHHFDVTWELVGNLKNASRTFPDKPRPRA